MSQKLNEYQEFREKLNETFAVMIEQRDLLKEIKELLSGD